MSSAIAILDWERAVRAGTSVCGGKGWNLARYGFPVPDGGVLVTEAYHRLLHEACLQDELAALADWDADVLLKLANAAHLATLRERMLSTPLPGPVETAVRKFVERQHQATIPLAVRSSAVAEDSEHHSFAGMHESVLGVTGLPAVITAVRRCYASLWTPHAVAYRRHAGIWDAAAG